MIYFYILASTVILWRCYSCKYHNSRITTISTSRTRTTTTFTWKLADGGIDAHRGAFRHGVPNEPHVNLFRFIQARALSTFGPPALSGLSLPATAFSIPAVVARSDSPMLLDVSRRPFHVSPFFLNRVCYNASYRNVIGRWRTLSDELHDW